MKLATFAIGFIFGILMGALAFGGSKEIKVPVIIRLDTGETEQATILDLMMSLDILDIPATWILARGEYKFNYLVNHGIHREEAANFVIILDEAARRWAKKEGNWVVLRDKMIHKRRESYR